MNVSRGLKIAAVVIGVLLLLVIALSSAYLGRRNEMVIRQESIRGQWSQVHVVLQRRVVLIPKLVGTLKGYATHEEEIFTRLAEARAAMMGARTPGETIAANQRIESALGRLLVIVENYPNLKANENFLHLQDELAGTENRIAVERRRYNQAVQDYNTYIQLFPNTLVASFSGFAREEAYFQAAEEATQVPHVEFAR